MSHGTRKWSVGTLGLRPPPPAVAIALVLLIALFNPEQSRADGQEVETAASTWGLDTTTEAFPACGPAQVVRSNYSNLRVHPNNNSMQSELSLAFSPADADRMLIGSNVLTISPYQLKQGYYYSTTAGTQWDGSDTLAGMLTGGTDPAVAFDAEGNAYFVYMSYTGFYWNLFMRKSTTGGATWVTDTDTLETNYYNPDKPHLAIDQSSGSYEGNIYVAWTSLNAHPNFTHRNIAFSRTTIDLWPEPADTVISISEGVVDSGGISTICQGVNLVVAPDGTLYAAWAIYDNWYTGVPSETAIGFNRSLDGGATWGEATRIIGVDGIREYPDDDALPPKEFRAHSFPVMAVDTAGGGKGTIYLVWADDRYGAGPNGYKDADILMISSTDGGLTWSDTTNPTRVNSDSEGNGRDQWFPWIAVDPAGGVNVAFYDCRSDADNYMTEVWLARSEDGGESFTNHRLSEVSFEPCVIRESSRYLGDYLGIAATAERVYTVWWDNRIRPQGYDYGVYQAFLGDYPLTGISGTTTGNAEWALTTLLTGDVTIDAGDTVTIRPGAKVLASDDADSIRLVVEGHLILEGEDDKRPTFLSESETPGGWYGIVVAEGGSVDWGEGARILDAVVGVTYEEGAAADTIQSVHVENSLNGFRLYSEAVLIHDTVTGASAGTGIQLANCDADIRRCHIENCETGIATSGSAGTIDSCTVLGPGGYGLYLSNPDDLEITSTDVQGFFTTAHLYTVGGETHLTGCEFISEEYNENWTPYGVYALGGKVVLRDSRLQDYGQTGFYSSNSTSDLGVSPTDPGGNSITSESEVYYVYHSSMQFGPGGGDLKAEGNWWGADPPSSSLFYQTDYTPWLEEDPLGKRAIQFVEESLAALPEEFSVGSNYPNPFNPATTIRFSLPVAGHVRVEVFNILGQRVRELVDGEIAAGQHQVVWDGTDDREREVTSGVYLYRVVSGGLTQSKKMVLMR